MKKIILSLLTVSALAACSSTGDNNANYDSQHALENWNRYHEDSIKTKQLKDNQALAVFYRTEKLNGEGVNVYVNGDYQASLLENSYSPVAVCADKPLFSASRVTNQRFGNRTDGVRYELENGKTHYFKLIQKQSGQLSFDAVPAAQAQAELVGLKGEIRHTLPRVVNTQNCEPKSETKTLSANALWGLDKHSYADMLPQGKQELAEFAEYLKNSPEITRIDISGFTDPEGADGYNQALSQRRADTVRQVLKQAGVKQEISATGYGETRLVVADCAVKHSNRKARAACNLPNRRVEIITYK